MNGGYSTNYFKVSRGVSTRMSPKSLAIRIGCRDPGSKDKAIYELPWNKVTAISRSQN